MTSSLRAIDLPPPFRLAALREAGDAFAHATLEAGELGAGALVFVGRFDLAEFAVVLEPEEPLAAARRSFYCGMVALADTLAALAPPETPIAIQWPDAIEVNRGLVGGGRLTWPRQADEGAVPDWLVFGAAVRLAWVRRGAALAYPQATALSEEGFGMIDAERFVAGFARHLMATLDRWHEEDFAGIAQDFLRRLAPENGERRIIDIGGNLRVERLGAPAKLLDLRTVLAAPSWLDPQTGEPRLRREGGAVR